MKGDSCRVGVTMPIEDGLSAPQMVELIRLAEQGGFHTALCGEVAGPEVMALLGAAAQATSRIRLGTGIVASYTRSPALAAMGFATLSSLAPGRIVAGIGASSPIVVGKWHGLDFDKPFSRTKEFVERMKECLSGDRVVSDGPILPVDGFRLATDPEGPVPLWLAAINDRMLRLAGAVADGVFLTWCPPDEVSEKVAIVRSGAIEAGRDPDDIEVICSFWGYAGQECDRTIARLKRVVLQYAMVPTHMAAFTHAFPRLVDAADAWTAGDRASALSFVDDEVVAVLCAVSEDGSATADMVREYHAAGVDTPIVLAIGSGNGDTDGPFSTVQLTGARLGLGT
jgi:probable F420-dependent oxidoreductase